MAEAVFNHLAKEHGLDAVASSAGLYTTDGLPYSPNSVEVLRENGIILVGTSKQITAEMLDEYDYVFGLTYSLSTALVSAFPGKSDRIYRFPLEVPDPFGGDIALYKRSFAKITEGIEKIIKVVKTREE